MKTLVPRISNKSNRSQVAFQLSKKTMSNICFLAVLLFYNVATTVSDPSVYQSTSYDERVDDARFNLLELLNDAAKRDASAEDSAEPAYLRDWTGRWFPDRPGDPTPPPKILPNGAHQLHLSTMGKIDNCDDGKLKLEVDWDESPVNYTCFGGIIQPELDILPLIYRVTVPPAYQASHICMNETIEYDVDVPLYGAHRPVYPVYGEYKFLPKQRWLHSLEHGGVVMLYHPCANPLEVKLLKDLVRKCLRRHVISPYNLLDRERPLALLTWGTSFTMSYVNSQIVRDFIRQNGLRGPEEILDDGDFSEGLLSRSVTITDLRDSVLCPHM